MRSVVLLLVVAAALLSGCDDDDVAVDRTAPGARRAAAEALTVVSGRVVEVARDRDNGKWEVVVEQAGGRYEVELDARTLRFLRLDFD